MCDCEVPQRMDTHYPVARKKHRCCECAAWIEPKTRYELIKGIWDHQWSTFKTCLECVKFRKDKLAQAREEKDWYYCDPCFGGLYDDLSRDEWPEHMVKAQAILKEEIAARKANEHQ